MHLPHSSGIPLVGGVGIGRGGGLPLPAGKEGMPGLSSLSNFGMGKDAMHVPGLPPALGTGKEGARGASVRSPPLLSLWRVRAVSPLVVFLWLVRLSDRLVSQGWVAFP